MQIAAEPSRKKNGSPTVHLTRDYHPEPSRRLQAEANKSQCGEVEGWRDGLGEA
jgi:hypothetical protein